MSIFDEIGTALSSVLSDPQRRQGLIRLAVDLLNSPEIGGLGGLAKTFQEKNLGDVISSWIGTGQNQPISSEQMQQVLGDETLRSLTAKAGLPSENIASDLAVLLPELIDKLTPNGKIEETSSLNPGDMA